MGYYARFTCSFCGHEVSPDARYCPHCNITLSGIRCQGCGFTSSEASFKNDRCPKCNTAVVVSRSSPPKQAEQNDTIPCPNCNEDIDQLDLICPHCKHTRWDMIGCFIAICVGFALAAVVTSFFHDWLGWLCIFPSAITFLVLVVGMIET